jgi:release factor glutamine methyltransferase
MHYPIPCLDRSRRKRPTVNKDFGQGRSWLHTSSTLRSIQPPSKLDEERLLTTLCRNPDLAREDAKNELRWIIEETEVTKGASYEEEVSRRVERRGDGEPLQYILGMLVSRLRIAISVYSFSAIFTGNTDFGPLNLLCRPPVLIPRPETAFVFSQLAKLVADRYSSSGKKNKVSILDLYTGSGAIALLLRHELGRSVLDLVLVGFDVNPVAIALAKENGSKVRMEEVSFAKTNVMESSVIMDASCIMGGRVHMITANPPYIPFEEYQALSTSVRDYEDVDALLGDGDARQRLDLRKGDGLSHYRRIASLLKLLCHEPQDALWWNDRGLPQVAVEIGAKQGQAVSKILSQDSQGFIRRTEIWKDQYDRDRMVVGWSV